MLSLGFRDPGGMMSLQHGQGGRRSNHSPHSSRRSCSALSASSLVSSSSVSSASFVFWLMRAIDLFISMVLFVFCTCSACSSLENLLLAYFALVYSFAHLSFVIRKNVRWKWRVDIWNVCCIVVSAVGVIVANAFPAASKQMLSHSLWCP